MPSWTSQAASASRNSTSAAIITTALPANKPTPTAALPRLLEISALASWISSRMSLLTWLNACEMSSGTVRKSSMIAMTCDSLEAGRSRSPGPRIGSRAWRRRSTSRAAGVRRAAPLRGRTRGLHAAGVAVITGAVTSAARPVPFTLAVTARILAARAATRTRGLEEADQSKSGDHGGTEERRRMPAGKVLELADQLAYVAPFQRVGDALDLLCGPADILRRLRYLAFQP